jgi:hypothetical protein
MARCCYIRPPPLLHQATAVFDIRPRGMLNATAGATWENGRRRLLQERPHMLHGLYVTAASSATCGVTVCYKGGGGYISVGFCYMRHHRMIQGRRRLHGHQPLLHVAAAATTIGGCSFYKGQRWWRLLQTRTF